MKIGIAANGSSLNSIVADRFADCIYLLVVDIKDHLAGDTVGISSVTVIKNEEGDSGIRLAEELVKYDCEAVITGDLVPYIFDFIADACITRYNGAGYPALTALELMERRELKLIRNLEGTDNCDESHHKPETRG